MEIFVYLIYLHIYQFGAVTQSCLTFCDTMDHSTPGHLSITNSQSPPKLMSIESVMPSSHLMLSCPLPLFLPSSLLAQGLFQWVSSSHHVAKVLEFQVQYQSFQWNQDWFPLGWTGRISRSKGLSRVFSNTTVQKHQLFSAQLSL